MGVFGEPPWEARGTHLAGEGWGRPSSRPGPGPWVSSGFWEGHFWNANPSSPKGESLACSGVLVTRASVAAQGTWLHLSLQGLLGLSRVNFGVCVRQRPSPTGVSCSGLGVGWFPHPMVSEEGVPAGWLGGWGWGPAFVKGCEAGGRVGLGDPRKQRCGCCLSIRQLRLSVLVRESGSWVGCHFP